MTLTIVGISHKLCQCVDKKGETIYKVGTGAFVFDICAIFAGIVVGALALCGYMDFPPAASYATLGVGCGFLALDVAFIMMDICSSKKPATK